MIGEGFVVLNGRSPILSTLLLEDFLKALFARRGDNGVDCCQINLLPTLLESVEASWMAHHLAFSLKHSATLDREQTAPLTWFQLASGDPRVAEVSGNAVSIRVVSKAGNLGCKLNYK